jgi:hypothetical protein
MSEASEMTKFKINLFSVSGSNDQMMATENYAVSNYQQVANNRISNQSDEGNNNFDMNQKLEKIISHNVMMESYTNKLSKQSNQMIIQASAAVTAAVTDKKRSESSSTISSMSSSQSHADSDLGVVSAGLNKNENGSAARLSNQSTSHHQRALQMSSVGNVVKTEHSFVKMNNIKKPSTPGN